MVHPSLHCNLLHYNLLSLTPIHHQSPKVGLITLNALSPKITRLFNALLVKRTGEKLKVPFTAELAGDFTPPGNPVEHFLESWHDLDARVRPSGRILLGYRYG